MTMDVKSEFVRVLLATLADLMPYEGDIEMDLATMEWFEHLLRTYNQHAKADELRAIKKYYLEQIRQKFLENLKCRQQD